MNIFDFLQMEEPEWRSKRACFDADPDIFFPERGETNEKAMAYCNRCPVTEECLAWAVKHGERGVWGGTSERGRRRLVKAAS